MKKACISFLGVLIIIALAAIFAGKGESKTETEYLRIHIRANSNLEADQSIKYEIKDLVVAYFTPLVKSIRTKAEAKAVFEKEKSNVNGLIDGFLRSKGFEYTANTVIDNEYFPTRMYEDLTLDAGYYDAVVIRLGKAEGDNWWCVVYPPLCFTGEGVTYKSIVYEYLRKFF
ncbi:MAG: stage II sporulation protein R [Clostridia bacterium]|nr:stage II sporulation protein R [Clostridia bacterium]